MDVLLLYLLTACLLGGAPLLTEARRSCSNCTNVWPRLPCAVRENVCEFPLQKNKPVVGPVLNVTVNDRGFFRPGPGNRPVLNVSWEIPKEGYEHVTGFLITLFGVSGSSDKICYHLDMQNARWTKEDDSNRLRLSFDCLVVHWNIEYLAKIIALPNQPGDSPEFTVHQYSQPKKYQNDSFPAPSDWIPSIMYIKHENNNQIDVLFKPYNHPEYTITSYRVQLLRINNSENTLSAIVTEYNVSMPIAFYNVCIPGDWRATVRGLTMANTNPCKNTNGIGCVTKDNSCRPCEQSTTSIFHFKPANPCIHVSEPKDMMIVGTVVGICAGCLLASLLVAITIYYSKTCGGESPTLSQSETPHLLPPPIPQNNRVKAPGKPIIAKSKSVLILYEEDTERHTTVVHRFANFLQHHCECNVIFDQWESANVRKDSIGWLLKHLDLSDKIIVIHSEGGYKRYQMKKNEIVSDKPTSPKIGLFVSGVEKLINERMDGSRLFKSSKKTVSVHMPYTPHKFVISHTSSTTFELMKDLEQLVRHIHGATRPDVVMKGISPNVCYSRYSELAEGHLLKTAIEKMSRFVQENPTWFPEMPVSIVKDEDTSSDYGTIENSNQSSMRGNSVSSRPADTSLLEATGEDPIDEADVKLEDPEELTTFKDNRKTEELTTFKDNRKTAEQRESITSSKVALLAQNFEQNSLPRNKPDITRLGKKASKTSKKSDSSADNLNSVPEVLYAQPLSKSARSSKASYNDIEGFGNGMTSTRSASEASRHDSCASTEPLYSEVNEKDTPGAGRKSVKDYNAYIDDNFKGIYDQSTGEPES